MLPCLSSGAWPPASPTVSAEMLGSLNEQLQKKVTCNEEELLNQMQSHRPAVNSRVCFPVYPAPARRPRARSLPQAGAFRYASSQPPLWSRGQLREGGGRREGRRRREEGVREGRGVCPRGGLGRSRGFGLCAQPRPPRRLAWALGPSLQCSREDNVQQETDEVSFSGARADPRSVPRVGWEGALESSRRQANPAPL